MRRWTNTSPRKVSVFSCFILAFVICMSFLITLLCPDYKTGFGGNFGVQSDRVDKSAVGWEHHEQVDKHESQKGEQIKRQKSGRVIISSLCVLDYKTGFGGQFGVQADRVDRSAVGWDHREKVRQQRFNND